jgi:hypothetical protein
MLMLAACSANAPGEVLFGTPEHDDDAGTYVPDALADRVAPSDLPRSIDAPAPVDGVLLPDGAAPSDLPRSIDAPAPFDGVTTPDRPAPRDLVTPPDRPTATDVAPDGCAARGDGSWCVGASLRACAEGRTTRVTECPDGCYDRGAASACASDAVDPCFNDPDGAYCGSSIGAVIRTGDVWICRGRRTERVDSCAMGCEGPYGGGRCRAPAPADPCAGASSGDGAYCGASLNAGARDTLYVCRGRVTASATACAHGCAVRPPGQPDACNPPPATGSGFRLPFACGASVRVTQGNNSAYSHSGTQAWAYDFGVGRGTAVLAMEGGTVSHANSSVVSGGRCWNGGGSECANTVNYVVLAHGDGTSTLYLHLDAAEVAVGATVTRGQRIARSGNTGWSSGAHLHVQRQGRCGSWFCASASMTFAEVGMPAGGATVTSGNCP